MLHFVALVLSVAGALFISQPQFLFGVMEGSSQSPIGYLTVLEVIVYFCWLCL